jgi:hypothetical protein
MKKVLAPGAMNKIHKAVASNKKAQATPAATPAMTKVVTKTVHYGKPTQTKSAKKK